MKCFIKTFEVERGEQKCETVSSFVKTPEIDMRFVNSYKWHNRFFGDLPISVLYRNFEHVNKTCQKQSILQVASN